MAFLSLPSIAVRIIGPGLLGTRSLSGRGYFLTVSGPAPVERVASQGIAGPGTAYHQFVYRSFCVHFTFIFRSVECRLSRIGSAAADGTRPAGKREAGGLGGGGMR